jgi:meso-butanediol dehydrogenase / (S,S)-butanediol dehydrogenase / diacetyl reductase
MTKSGKLAGKVAIVTGGASGMGAATARLFVEEGASVAVLDIQPTPEAPGILPLLCDVTKEAEVREAVATVIERLGPIHVLFNNAGAAGRQTVEDHDEASWDLIVDTTLKGAYLCSRYALPHFADGGSIVHMSSVTGVMGFRNRAAYSAAKAAIVGLTRNMALDYAARRIRVNCVCPGFVRTPFIRALLADPERTAKVTALHPLGRLGEPEDIARLVLFLASDDASWITGQAIAIDGGASAGQYADI